MADTIRETIMAAIAAALDGAGKPAELTVHRFRARSLDRDDMPAMAVYHLGETVALETHDEPSVLRTLTIRVEHRVKTLATSADAPDKTARSRSKVCGTRPTRRTMMRPVCVRRAKARVARTTSRSSGPTRARRPRHLRPRW